MHTSSSNLKVAVVGATGMVGQTMLQVLEQRRFPVGELLPVASAKSMGRTVAFHGKDIPVMSMGRRLGGKAQCRIVFSWRIREFGMGTSVCRGWNHGGGQQQRVEDVSPPQIGGA